jgi:hypothetical protein
MNTIEDHKIVIGYDIERKRLFDKAKEFKKSAFLDVLRYVNGFNGINIPKEQFKDLKTNFLNELIKTYSKDYPGISERKLFDLFNVDLLKLEELEENYNRYSMEIDTNGNPLNEPDCNFYAENESEITIYHALQNILKSLHVLKNNGRMVLIGELNNSLFGAFEIDLQHLIVKPKAEFIKNPRYSKRRGNPRLKL